MAKYLLLILVCISLAYVPAYSQEEDVEYGYGTVVEIKKDSNEIVVSEYDWESEEEVDVTYSIHEDLKIENIDSWKEIPNETYIDIEYVIDADGKRIAKYINAHKTEEIETEEIETETE